MVCKMLQLISPMFLDSANLCFLFLADLQSSQVSLLHQIVIVVSSSFTCGACGCSSTCWGSWFLAGHCRWFYRNRSVWGNTYTILRLKLGLNTTLKLKLWMKQVDKVILATYSGCLVPLTFAFGWQIPSFFPVQFLPSTGELPSLKS